MERGVAISTLSLADYVRCLCVLPNGDLVAGCEDSVIAVFSEKDFSFKKNMKGHRRS